MLVLANGDICEYMSIRIIILEYMSIVRILEYMSIVKILEYMFKIVF